MCLSTQALILFIGLLPQEIVTPAETHVKIAANTGVVIWENFDDQWCTIAPLVETSTRK